MAKTLVTQITECIEHIFNVGGGGSQQENYSISLWRCWNPGGKYYEKYFLSRACISN